MFEGMDTELRALGQAVIALILGGILGWEREVAGKGAGLRTHMLICLGSMVFIKVGQFLIVDTEGYAFRETIRADPVRIIEAIVTGISFIGAGMVFRDPDRNVARGLTTAASLLAVAPIGIAVAIDRYVLAVGVTVLVLVVLRVINWIETKWFPAKRIEAEEQSRLKRGERRRNRR